ncbi:hypothetical protein FQA47_015042 [Oryzias melastigma]|uniref:Uncharacterized protein n=1 Tax=Oryzias melastigma TaxID=30732 RepID=A0A834C2N5_ORYME|nr:hypothetical protein FQA47_015042 [Oryzias melastigma]
MEKIVRRELSPARLIASSSLTYQQSGRTDEVHGGARSHNTLRVAFEDVEPYEKVGNACARSPQPNHRDEEDDIRWFQQQRPHPRTQTTTFMTSITVHGRAGASEDRNACAGFGSRRGEPNSRS